MNIDLSDLPIFLTKHQFCDVVQCSSRTLDRWIHSGCLSTVRTPGRKQLIPRVELERVLLGAEQ